MLESPATDVKFEGAEARAPEGFSARDGFYVSRFISGTTAQSSSNYGVIFIAWHPCELIAALERHEVAATDLGTVELKVLRLIDGEDISSSSNNMLATQFNLKGTADTTQTRSGTDLSTNLAYRQVRRGEAVALCSNGALNTLEGVTVTLYFKFLGRGAYL